MSHHHTCSKMFGISIGSCFFKAKAKNVMHLKIELSITDRRLLVASVFGKADFTRSIIRSTYGSMTSSTAMAIKP